MRFELMHSDLMLAFLISLFINGVLLFRNVTLGFRKKLLLRYMRGALEMDKIMFDTLRVITLKAKGYDPIHEAKTAINECGKVANRFLENNNAKD